jgi:hypothetical protein
MNSLTHDFPSAFTRAELEALVSAMDERIEQASAAHHWSNPTWGAVTYARQLWSLAIDCLVELDGDQPETVNPQAELADMLDDACLSVHHAMQRHMAAQAVKVAA